MTPDARELFLDAADSFVKTCERIGVDQLGLPGLGEWDVRSLAGHTLRAVTTVTTYLAAPAPDRITCEAPGTVLRHDPGAAPSR